MSDHDRTPPPDSPPLNGFGRPARRRGAASADATPRMEMVRVTQPDLERRKAMEKTRARLVITVAGFIVLFLAVLAKLTDATIINPLLPPRPKHSLASLVTPPQKAADTLAPGERASIIDRNGQILAISLPTVAVYADPRQIVDPKAAALKLKSALPRLDLAEAEKRLAESNRQFVYLARKITPREELAINALGIPGVDFLPTEERHYPMGRLAAQLLGGVNVDEQGIAGVEKWFNHRLLTNPKPLRLSIDIRVEGVVRDELEKAVQEFDAKGGAGIVMNVNTGEVLAMVSLPDYDANRFRTAPADARFNRAVTGVYEPGSTFKLQTLAMALTDGVVHIWDQFDASHNIHIGRFTISDFVDVPRRWLYLPEVLSYSSNIGAAHIATLVGSDRQRAWLRMMGMFTRSPIQLPEAAPPILHPKRDWRLATTMTVGFGQGIAVEPLQLITGTAAVATGILHKPTLLALPPGDKPHGMRVEPRSVALTMDRLMRLVVTHGTGTAAKVPGYYPGGKTGTTETVGKHGYHRGFKDHYNVSAFVSVFPMNRPRYAVYIMLDEPHGNKSTYGFTAAGWVAAPAAGRVIARIGPMLGLMPDIKDAPEINAELFIPRKPVCPPGAFALGPSNENLVKEAEKTPLGFRPNATQQTEMVPVADRPLRPSPPGSGHATRPAEPVRHGMRAGSSDHAFPREAEASRLIGARVIPASAVH